MMHVLRRVKLSSVLRQCITADWVLPFFVDIIAASFFSTRSHSFPQPPVTVKTRGVKVDFSISRTFAFSLSLEF